MERISSLVVPIINRIRSLRCLLPALQLTLFFSHIIAPIPSLEVLRLETETAVRIESLFGRPRPSRLRSMVLRNIIMSLTSPWFNDLLSLSLSDVYIGEAALAPSTRDYLRILEKSPDLETLDLFQERITSSVGNPAIREVRLPNLRTLSLCSFHALDLLDYINIRRSCSVKLERYYRNSQTPSDPFAPYSREPNLVMTRFRSIRHLDITLGRCSLTLCGKGDYDPSARLHRDRIRFTIQLQAPLLSATVGSLSDHFELPELRSLEIHVRHTHTADSTTEAVRWSAFMRKMPNLAVVVVEGINPLGFHLALSLPHPRNTPSLPCPQLTTLRFVPQASVDGVVNYAWRCLAQSLRVRAQQNAPISKLILDPTLGIMMTPEDVIELQALVSMTFGTTLSSNDQMTWDELQEKLGAGLLGEFVDRLSEPYRTAITALN
ncbi:hypothetical protein JAAARDRAFT_78966 [Jaapia argillacea MUCL 33604]|uniref:F-box domain-containing protein n=1 Tax=Jaapia argillacea MUCL 33604 TaxID=933084 RepID=A0A067PQU6_9AGAM|nr:hypothetical protein JAAARDRAFT_78966 [Jaapia argillacea MUCL 33604]